MVIAHQRLAEIWRKRSCSTWKSLALSFSGQTDGETEFRNSGVSWFPVYLTIYACITPLCAMRSVKNTATNPGISGFQRFVFSPSVCPECDHSRMVLFSSNSVEALWWTEEESCFFYINFSCLKKTVTRSRCSSQISASNEPAERQVGTVSESIILHKTWVKTAK